jgi:hypothetical protein
VTLLLLNRRDILGDVSQWFPDSREAMAVITSRDAASDQNLRNFLLVETLDDYQTPLVEDTARRLHRTVNFTRILSTAEADVMRAALLRAEFGLAGQDTESAKAYRNKFVMKTYAAAAGVRVAPMRLIADAAQLARFADEVGFPLVVKRIDGAASIGMRMVADAEALARLLRSGKIGPNHLAEGFVRGAMYHVDGMMSDGVVLHAWPSRYLFSQWETMYRGQPNISGMLSTGHPLHGPLLDATAAVVGALPPAPDPLAFHAEFFNPRGDEVVFCEIACRPGGAGIVDTYERAFGINLYRAALLGQAGRRFNVAVGRPAGLFGWAFFPPRNSKLVALPSTCPLPDVLWFETNGEAGRRFAEPRFVTDHIARMAFLVQETDPYAKLECIAKWWSRAVVWM